MERRDYAGILGFRGYTDGEGHDLSLLINIDSLWRVPRNKMKKFRRKCLANKG
jgi:hypothetical protein